MQEDRGRRPCRPSCASSDKLRNTWWWWNMRMWKLI